MAWLRWAIVNDQEFGQTWSTAQNTIGPQGYMLEFVEKACIPAKSRLLCLKKLKELKLKRSEKSLGFEWLLFLEPDYELLWEVGTVW